MHKKIIVTTSWDDGYKTDLKLAGLLKKYKIKGTFYISRDEDKNLMLTEADIKRISKSFEIGAHTQNHLHLTKVPKFIVTSEVKESKKYLEKLIGKKINCFCYPYGEVNSYVEKVVINSGFKMARTVQRFNTERSENNFLTETTVHAYTHIKDFFNIKLMAKYKTNDWEKLAKKQFDYVLQNGGIFHLWGHSWEIDEFKEWKKLERVLRYIGNKKNVLYLENSKIIK